MAAVNNTTTVKAINATPAAAAGVSSPKKKAASGAVKRKEQKEKKTTVAAAAAPAAVSNAAPAQWIQDMAMNLAKEGKPAEAAAFVAAMMAAVAPAPAPATVITGAKRKVKAVKSDSDNEVEEVRPVKKPKPSAKAKSKDEKESAPVATAEALNQKPKAAAAAAAVAAVASPKKTVTIAPAPTLVDVTEKGVLYLNHNIVLLMMRQNEHMCHFVGHVIKDLQTTPTVRQISEEAKHLFPVIAVAHPEVPNLMQSLYDAVVCLFDKITADAALPIGKRFKFTVADYVGYPGLKADAKKKMDTWCPFMSKHEVMVQDADGKYSMPPADVGMAIHSMLAKLCDFQSAAVGLSYTGVNAYSDYVLAVLRHFWIKTGYPHKLAHMEIWMSLHRSAMEAKRAQLAASAAAGARNKALEREVSELTAEYSTAADKYAALDKQLKASVNDYPIAVKALLGFAAEHGLPSAAPRPDDVLTVREPWPCQLLKNGVTEMKAHKADLAARQKANEENLPKDPALYTVRQALDYFYAFDFDAKRKIKFSDESNRVGVTVATLMGWLKRFTHLTIVCHGATAVFPSCVVCKQVAASLACGKCADATQVVCSKLTCLMDHTVSGCAAFKPIKDQKAKDAKYEAVLAKTKEAEELKAGKAKAKEAEAEKAKAEKAKAKAEAAAAKQKLKQAADTEAELVMMRQLAALHKQTAGVDPETALAAYKSSGVFERLMKPGKKRDAVVTKEQAHADLADQGMHNPSPTPTSLAVAEHLALAAAAAIGLAAPPSSSSVITVRPAADPAVVAVDGDVDMVPVVADAPVVNPPLAEVKASPKKAKKAKGKSKGKKGKSSTPADAMAEAASAAAAAARPACKFVDSDVVEAHNVI